LLDRTRNRMPPDRFDADPEESFENSKMMRHIIAVLLENEAGALSRVANLFSARGYNIEALSVAPTDNDSVSRMTIVTSGTDAVIEQIIKQLNKLIDVIKLVDLTEDAHFERELMLIKVAVKDDGKALKKLAGDSRGQIVDVSGSIYTIELTDECQKLDAFLKQLQQYEVVEIVRSGPLGIARGERALHI
jgi:acetolactate synthase-1/3 small subunit